MTTTYPKELEAAMLRRALQGAREGAAAVGDDAPALAALDRMARCEEHTEGPDIPLVKPGDEVVAYLFTTGGMAETTLTGDPTDHHHLNVFPAQTDALIDAAEFPESGPMLRVRIVVEAVERDKKAMKTWLRAAGKVAEARADVRKMESRHYRESRAAARDNGSTEGGAS